MLNDGSWCGLVLWNAFNVVTWLSASHSTNPHFTCVVLVGVNFASKL